MKYAHLRDRDNHPKNRPVMTPKGWFASASRAAEAFGISRQAVARKCAHVYTDYPKEWHYVD